MKLYGEKFALLGKNLTDFHIDASYGDEKKSYIFNIIQNSVFDPGVIVNYLNRVKPR